MPELPNHFTTPPSACPYLPGECASLEYRIMLHVSAAEYDQLLVRGWRRFGPEYFRPVCAACMACVSLRVPVATFKPTKSQRCALRRCAGLRLEIGPPRLDSTRLALYHTWHAWRERERGWPEQRLSPREFFLQFCFEHPCVREFAYYDGPRLMGVGIVDETPTSLSAVYFYFDPDYERLSPGRVNVLRQIEDAREKGLAFVYLGFRVAGCRSMEYKAQFRPHQLLLNRPGPDEEPEWMAEEKHPLKVRTGGCGK